MAKIIKAVLDPGHGGKDRRNRGKLGYIEADGVLDISLKLKKELESTGLFEVTMTRTTDETLSLTDRGKMAKGSDLFISEHTNAGGGSGTEVFYSVDLPSDKNFAAAISKSISKIFGKPDRGAKTRYATVDNIVDDNLPGEDYYTVMDVAQDVGCKHVFIVESLFHDNIQEEAILLDDLGRLKIAQAQAKAICEYFGIPYTPTTSKKPLEDWEIILLGSSDNPNYWYDRLKYVPYLPKLIINIRDYVLKAYK